jgi:Flp pilus assembly protein TadG
MRRIHLGAGLRSRARALLAPGARERGYSVVELVILLPLLFVVVVGIIQFALYAMAGNAAQTAASQALAAVKAQGGTAAEGQAQAEAVLAEMTGSILSDKSVAVARGGQQATVTVTGQAVSIFGVTIHITKTVQGPVERLYQR